MKLFTHKFYNFVVSNKKQRNLYEVLKIPKSASQEEVKNSYYKLAKQYHPDTHQSK